MAATTEPQRIADVLRVQILKGAVPADGRLPPELQLAANFGVSRATMREALRILSSEGLILSKRGVGGGTFVVVPDNEFFRHQIRNSLELFSQARTVDVSHLVEGRILLEVPAARLAAERRTKEDVAALRQHIRTPPEATREEIWEANKLFHERIFTAASNPIVELLVSPLHLLVSERFARRSLDDAFWVRIAEEHNDIAQAIDRGNAEASASFMLSHLKRLSSIYVKIARSAG